MAGTKYYATVENKIKPLQPVTPNMSNSNVDALASAFPQSPMNLEFSAGGINENERQLQFKKLVLDGEVINGNGIANYNRDFSKNGAPDVPNITEDNAGKKLYSPYIPNPTSPGVGSVDPNDKPMHTVPAPDPVAQGEKQFGVGFTGIFNPIASAEAIEDQGVNRPLGASSFINEP